jgi:hypothetical protein
MSPGVEFFFGHFEMPGFVIHAIAIAILKDRMIPTSCPFPRSVVFEDNFLRDGMMKLQSCFADQIFNQKLVHEQLSPSADIDDIILQLRGSGLLTGRESPKPR